MADFISKSFVHAKRRQYECMASDAGKLHGRYRNGMGTALISACHALISVFGRDPGLVFSWQLRGSNGTKWNSPSTYGVLQVTDCRVILANRFPFWPPQGSTRSSIPAQSYAQAIGCWTDHCQHMRDGMGRSSVQYVGTGDRALASWQSPTNERLQRRRGAVIARRICRRNAMGFIPRGALRRTFHRVDMHQPLAPAQPSVPSVPKAIGLGLRLRLPDDGQRHLRCGAKGGDAAIGQSVGIVLAAVLDLKVQPRAPAFAGHLAAVGFAGQVHPGAGAVLGPEAVDAKRRVYVQAEALGAAAFGQADLELRQAEGRLHAVGLTGGGFVERHFADARVAVGDQFAVPAAGHQGLVAG